MTSDRALDIALVRHQLRTIGDLIDAVRRDRKIFESDPPLTPEQMMKRQERDRQRQQRIRDIQASTSRRIQEIKSKIGK